MTIATPRQLLAPAPPERLAALRVVVTSFALLYLLLRLPHLLDMFRLGETAPERFRPVGPLVALDGPLSPAVMTGLLAVTLLAGCLALLGWRWRLTGPTFAIGVLVVLSHRNSFGQIFHTENLLVLHLVILAAAPAAAVWSLDARRSRPSSTVEPSPGYGWPAQLMVLVVVVAYVLAGWAKLRASGLDWVGGDALRNLVAHDALRKELVGGQGSPLAALALRNDWIFAPLAVASLLVEVAAPIALLGGRWRLGWVIAAWCFHLGVLVVMGILFPYQLLGVAFAAFVTIEVAGHRLIGSSRQRTANRAILAP